jgi:hypothetical protein
MPRRAAWHGMLALVMPQCCPELCLILGLNLCLCLNPMPIPDIRLPTQTMLDCMPPPQHSYAQDRKSPRQRSMRVGFIAFARWSRRNDVGDR